MTSYNPYAAPATPGPEGDRPPAVGEPQPWEVGEVIRAGWELYKPNWASFTFGYLVIAVISSLPGQIAPGLVAADVLEKDSVPYWSLSIVLSLVGWVLSTFFAIGFARAGLRATRTGVASFGDFFSGGDFLAFMGMSILKAIAILLGCLLLVVPGIILALGFANAPFYVVDQKLGPVAALRASWDSADGQKSSLFVLELAEIGLMLVGLVACCFGVFVVVPVILIARAIVYTRMSGTAPPPAAPPGAYGAAGYGPAGYAPPGYGPPGGPGYGGYEPPGGSV